MGLTWKIKMKILYQFLVSLEVSKFVDEVPLGLDDQAYNINIFIFLWWFLLENMFIKSCVIILSLILVI